MATNELLTYSGAEVEENLGISKGTRLNWGNPKHPDFDPTWPQPLCLSARSKRYRRHEIVAWLDSRPRARNAIQAEGE